MRKRYTPAPLKKALLAVLAVGLLIGAIVWLKTQKGAPSVYDTFAQCLSEKKAVMYGAYWCSHCRDQKEAFGSSFSHVSYIECATQGSSAQTKVCTDAGIKGYPTWVFADGTRIEGVMSFKTLSEKTSCPLP
ncbi:MAG: thioredoxin domain-containing protein [bacterium]|nr:thioredoxin domain-containing protein [bacterium]